MTNLQAQQTVELSKQIIKQNLTEEQLYGIIGTSMCFYGYDVGARGTFVQKITDADVNFTYNALNGNINMKVAIKKGSAVWKKMYDKLKRAICSNPKYIKAIKDYLAAGGVALILFIAALLGITAISPLAMAVIAAIVALIVQMGIDEFCRV